jgi:two-component system, LytTR family, sensor kinase
MKYIQYHFLFWILTYFENCFNHFSLSPTKIDWYSMAIILFNMSTIMVGFYVVLLSIIPVFWKPKKYLKFILAIFIITFIIFCVREYVYSLIPVPEGDITDNYSLITSILMHFFTILSVFPFAFAFYYAEKITLEQKAQAEIEQENFKLEQSIINTQLNNLKNQINPDFLFRKLDYFYQESLPHSASLSKGISLLSDMMHYAIDDDDEEGKVPLEKEITHIRNFIEINQLRFDGRLQVVFEVMGEVGTLKIMPLILITFVENAFKYGELMDIQNPVKIRLRLEDNLLFFSTYNRTRRGPKEQSEGIGMANTQKRLALGYPDQYRLEIRSEIDFYEVELEIKLT